MTHAKPLFSWVHATDLHYEQPGKASDCLNSSDPDNKRLNCFINDINRLQGPQKPEFLILSGDITERGSAVKQELIQAKETLSRLQVPFHILAGNHDLGPNREIAAVYPGKEDYHEGPLETSNFFQVFGPEGLRFSFQRHGFHFVGFVLRDADPDGPLDWLQAQVDAIPSRGIVIGHYGLYPARTAGFLLKWGFSRHEKCLPRLQSIINGANGRVIAYLNGHNHVNSVFKNEKTTHISGGCIKGGCTGYRLFECYPDRIATRFIFLSDPTLWNFNCWGQTDPGRCIDDTHPTPEDYHRGTPSEQVFEIPLTPPSPNT
jgi:hypothetical protein